MSTEIGRVTNVSLESETGQIYVAVKVSSRKHYERLKFTSHMSGLWMVPSEGDFVEVYTIGENSRAARMSHDTPPASMPDMGEGDFCLRLNEDTELFFKQSGGTFDLTIRADGDVTVDAPEVKLGDGSGNYAAVARVGDSVEVTDPDSGTLDGEITSGSSSVDSS